MDYWNALNLRKLRQWMGFLHAQRRVVLSNADKMIRGNQTQVLVVDHLPKGPETTFLTAWDNLLPLLRSFHAEDEMIIRAFSG